VRRALLSTILVLAGLAWGLPGKPSVRKSATPVLTPAQDASQNQSSSPQAPTPAPGASPQAPATPPSATTPGLRVVVLDPGHGGTDSGARGATGATEKDVALAFARACRTALEKLGLRVVLTRDGDQNPSFDDRAALANAQHDAIFLSLHVSSTGPDATVRVYTYQFSESESGLAAGRGTESPYGLTYWNLAQQPHTELSRRLGDLLQVQLAQTFSGSPEVSASVPVRDLRSVAVPAVAMEVSSVSLTDAGRLYALAPQLAQAVGRAVDAFRPVYEAARKKP
jgi:N-acetylmuramoyl-L-alanine amidase